MMDPLLIWAHNCVWLAYYLYLLAFFCSMVEIHEEEFCMVDLEKLRYVVHEEEF